MVLVYISSPYTIGNAGENVNVQLKVFDELLDLGYCPYAPLLSHFQHIYHPRSYDEWMSVDIEIVKRCDIVLRLPGISKGADREVKLAQELNIPVVYSIDELDFVYGANYKMRTPDYAH